MNAQKRLTDKQEEVLEFIAEFLITHDYPPTIRDIVRRFDMSSSNAAVCYLRALERKGYLVRDREVSRGMRLLSWSPRRTLAKVAHDLGVVPANLDEVQSDALLAILRNLVQRTAVVHSEPPYTKES
jgi:repressor LexA